MPVGSGSGSLNSDLLDPAENGPVPQPCWILCCGSWPVFFVDPDLTFGSDADPGCCRRDPMIGFTSKIYKDRFETNL